MYLYYIKQCFTLYVQKVIRILRYQRTAANRRLRFFINFERKIEENSYTDWTVKSSNNEQHSTFCEAQIPFHLREFFQYIAETGTPLEIQNDRRKYSRFGPGQPLMRAFRTVHTKKSVISGHLAIDQTKLDFNFDLNGK